MSVDTKANSCRRFFWGCVGTERLNGAVYEKHLGIRRLLEIINIGFVSLVGWAFNEVHGFTSNGAKHNFGDNC